MKRFLFFIAVAIVFCLNFSSCNVSTNVMREPNIRFEFNSNDIELSEQFSADVTVTRILWIDWERLCKNGYDGYANKSVGVPVLGSLVEDRAVNAALYKLMQEHPGYDVIVYPQYHKEEYKPVLGSHLYSKTMVKVTARLGKLKK